MASVIRPPSEDQARLLPALYRRANVKRRGSVLLQNGTPDGRLTQSFFPSAAGTADRGAGHGREIGPVCRGSAGARDACSAGCA
jgi:hypothetical protein